MLTGHSGGAPSSGTGNAARLLVPAGKGRCTASALACFTAGACVAKAEGRAVSVMAAPAHPGRRGRTNFGLQERTMQQLMSEEVRKIRREVHASLDPDTLGLRPREWNASTYIHRSTRARPTAGRPPTSSCCLSSTSSPSVNVLAGAGAAQRLLSSTATSMRAESVAPLRPRGGSTSKSKPSSKPEASKRWHMVIDNECRSTGHRAPQALAEQKACRSCRRRGH
eukprot:scaffold605_cov400-Prasinococcus_capsulatus_cf.AAC.14